MVDYADIADGTRRPGDGRPRCDRRGCLVVRGHFDREQALAWDAGIVDYVESNRFFETYRGPGDDFFGSVGSKPEIYPIYWSPAQMEARQSDRMARVQQFLNQQWISERTARDGSTPTATRSTPIASAAAPKARTRRARRTPRRRHPRSVDDAGLPAGVPPSVRRHGRAVRPVGCRRIAPTVRSTPARTMCAAFRTFQGWTALSDMDHDQGVLHTVPIPDALGYLLLRPLLADVADDDMCGVTVGKVFPVKEQWHSLLLEAVSGIPDVRAGDSVWWHCDMVHSVAPGRRPAGMGQRDVHPRRTVVPAQRGVRPVGARRLPHRIEPDGLPRGALRADVARRFQVDDLNEIGRRGLGLA